jgi:hypothetical protein
MPKTESQEFERGRRVGYERGYFDAMQAAREEMRMLRVCLHALLVRDDYADGSRAAMLEAGECRVPYVGLKVGAMHPADNASEYYCGRCGWPVTDHDSYCSECGGALHKSATIVTARAPRTP